MSKIIKPKRFVGLHGHSVIGSPFDGLGQPQQHIDFVLENGMDAWALTDHGNMNGYAHAHTHAEELKRAGRNFKFIPGCEFYVHPDLAQWKVDHAAAKVEKKALKSAESTGIEDEDASKQRNKFFDPVKRRHHMVVLAKSDIGLRNLFKLVTRGYKEGQYRFPRIDAKMLAEHGEGLIISTACIAGLPAWATFREFPDASFEELLPSLITDDNIDGICNILGTELDPFIQAVGPENFFLEVQFNKLGAQHLSNKAVIAFAEKSGIPLLATADSHYPRPDLWKDRELYKKLGWLNYKEYDPSLMPSSIDDLKCELYPKNADQMWDAYKQFGAGVYDFYDDQLMADAIERSHDIAHQLIGNPQPNTKPKYHSSVVSEGSDAFSELMELSKEGLIQKGLHEKPEYIERLKLELKTIRDLNFSPYFLMMKRIMEVAKENMLVGPARGSGAGSLVNYVLGITNLDPIQYGLLFGRFLNPHRKGMPDIDSDVADRDMLLGLLREEFGEDSIVPITNHNTLQLKSLIKDISRFYGVPFDEVNKATLGLEREIMRKVLGKGDDKNLFQLKFNDCMKHSKKFKIFMDKYPQVEVHIQNLLGQLKSHGRHAGGVLIADKMETNMPLIKVRGELQSSWVEGMHRKDLERYGNIKYDLLGLGTLRIIQRAIALILTRHEDMESPTFQDIRAWFDTKLDPRTMDLDDQDVYGNIYGRGKWAGIFQCVAEGTMIRTSGGAKRVEDVAVDDWVLSLQNSTQEWTEDICQGVETRYSECIQLAFNDGTTLTCTPDHWIMTDNRGWVEAGKLTEDDEITQGV